MERAREMVWKSKIGCRGADVPGPLEKKEILRVCFPLRTPELNSMPRGNPSITILYELWKVRTGGTSNKDQMGKEYMAQGKGSSSPFLHGCLFLILEFIFFLSLVFILFHFHSHLHISLLCLYTAAR